LSKRPENWQGGSRLEKEVYQENNRTVLSAGKHIKYTRIRNEDRVSLRKDVRLKLIEGKLYSLKERCGRSLEGGGVAAKDVVKRGVNKKRGKFQRERKKREKSQHRTDGAAGKSACYFKGLEMNFRKEV